MKDRLENILKNKKSAIIVSLFCMLLWGSAIPTIKMTYKALSVETCDTGAKILTAGIRFFMAGVLTFIYMFIFKEDRLDTKKINWSYIIILSLIQTSIQYTFYYIGLSNTSGVKASIIQAFNAFAVAILSALLIADEKLTKKKFLALFIGTLGILFANFKPGGDFSFNLFGEGAILASTCFNAMATVYVRWKGREENAFFTSASQFLFGSMALIFLGTYMGGFSGLSFNLKGVLLLSYGAFISATAFTLYTLVLHYHQAGKVGFYKLFVPIFGSIFSIVILKENFNYQLVIGMGLLLIGTIVLNRSKGIKIQK